ncbi:MAG: tetratricopeptide repeat protein, partial [Chitinophagaceae bacterium]
QARFHYRKASNMNPDDSKLYYKIATTYINEKQYEPAIKQLQQALKIHRLQPDFNHAMGICMMETGRFKEAVEYYLLVLQARPKNVKGWSALLNCLLRAGMLEEAKHFANAAFDQTGEKPLFLFYRTAIYFAMGKTKEAIRQLEDAMDKAPKLVKKLIELDPGILRHPQVVDILARHKRSKDI